MTDIPITISIDRSGMVGSPAPLVFSGSLDETPLGLVGYQPPAMQARVGYMPDSADTHGSEALTAAWQQALLGFDWLRDDDATETQVQASYAEVLAAIGQFSYTVTTQVNGAPAQVWAADMGSMTSAARTFEDLLNRNPVYSVTIPVYPIPVAS